MEVFDILEEILGSKPATRPTIVVDTLGDGVLGEVECELGEVSEDETNTDGSTKGMGSVCDDTGSTNRPELSPTTSEEK